MTDPTCCPSPPANKPISVALARALAEAADGYVGYPHPAFFVSPYVPEDKVFAGGFRVSGPYCGWKEVPEGLKEQVCNEEAGFFGPFDINFAPVVRGHRVSDVSLHIRDPQESFQVSLDNLDAMFFSTQAVEKFAVPYYERIFGPDFAKKVMDQFRQADVQVMGHFPWTEYADGTRLTSVPMVLQRPGKGPAAFTAVYDGIPPVRVPQTDAPARR